MGKNVGKIFLAENSGPTACKSGGDISSGLPVGSSPFVFQFLDVLDLGYIGWVICETLRALHLCVRKKNKERFPSPFNNPLIR